MVQEYGVSAVLQPWLKYGFKLLRVVILLARLRFEITIAA